VKKAGRALGRSADDVQPFIDLLRENWYDSIDSLRGIAVPDLVQLGLPQRFVKELMIALGEGGNSYDDTGGKKGKGKWKSNQSDWGDYPDTGKGKAKGKGKGKDDAKGKGKGKDDSKGRGKDEGKFGGKGKDKGKGKGDKDAKEYKHMHKIMLEIDDIDPGFRFKSKIIGSKARNVKHIRESTGAWVWLCGKGSGSDGQETDDALHVLVKSDDKATLDEAVGITNDLIDTIFEQYEDWLNGDRADDGDDGCFICGNVDHFAKECPDRGESSWKGKGKGKEKGKGKGKKGKRKATSGEGDGNQDFDEDHPPQKRARLGEPDEDCAGDGVDAYEDDF